MIFPRVKHTSDRRALKERYISVNRIANRNVSQYVQIRKINKVDLLEALIPDLSCQGS